MAEAVVRIPQLVASVEESVAAAKYLKDNYNKIIEAARSRNKYDQRNHQARVGHVLEELQHLQNTAKDDDKCALHCLVRELNTVHTDPLHSKKNNEKLSKWRHTVRDSARCASEELIKVCVLPMCYNAISMCLLHY
jgi:hypothetical protein